MWDCGTLAYIYEPMQGVAVMSQSKICIVSVVDDFFVILHEKETNERIFIPKDKFTVKAKPGDQLEITRDERLNGYVFKEIM